MTERGDEVSLQLDSGLWDCGRKTQIAPQNRADSPMCVLGFSPSPQRIYRFKPLLEWGKR